MSATSTLWFRHGGSGSPTLVLLHGLGGNARVWDGLLPLIEAHWPGRWLAPDLRGHGRSFHQTPYSFGTHAADVANLFDPNEEVVCLAHSMGGPVAMALASGWFGVKVRAVVAFGVKMEWRAEELVKPKQIAATPVRWFDRREDALDRYLKVSGLAGLIAADSECAAHGIVEKDGKYRLAMDPRANLVCGPPIDQLIRAMKAPLRLAAGEKDAMTTLEQMRRYDPEAVLLPGVGHSAHVEDAGCLWPLMEPIVARYASA